MTKRAISKSVFKDIAIVGAGVFIIWFGLWAYFGTENPFYVVASGSMLPELQVYDVLIVNANVPFEDVQIGDLVSFSEDDSRIFVHSESAVVGEIFAADEVRAFSRGSVGL